MAYVQQQLEVLIQKRANGKLVINVGSGDVRVVYEENVAFQLGAQPRAMA